MIKTKKYTPQKELVFIPSGGVKGISGVVSILCSKNDELPYVIVDSDVSGKDAVKKLKSGLYKDAHDKIIEIYSITSIENSEVEDIIPISLLERTINHFFNSVEDEDFMDNYEDDKPLVNQIEKFSSDNNVELEKGWKVELAKAAKKALLKAKEDKISNEYIEKWVKLFELIK